jgi:hypothetical protein
MSGPEQLIRKVRGLQSLQQALRPKHLEKQRSASSDQALLKRFRERYKDDYLAFTRLLEIDSKAGRVPFALNAIQLKYHYARTLRDVCLKARRCGMTTEAIARDLWHFLTFPSAAVAIVCQSGRDHQGSNTVRDILKAMIGALRKRGLPIDFDEDTKSRMTLDFGDYVASLSIIEAGASLAAAEKTGRAARYTRCHLTEQAYYEFAGATMASLRHCVPDVRYGSEVQVESTANGMGAEVEDPKDTDGAYEFRRAVDGARSGATGYKLHFFPWFDDPDNALAVAPGERIVPRGEREEWLATLGVRPEQLKWYQQQLALCNSQSLLDQEAPSDPETCFRTTGNGFFDADSLARMVQAAKPHIDARPIRESGVRQVVVDGKEVPAMRFWARPERGKHYVLAIDTSTGGQGDRGAGIVFQRGTGLHCATVWGQYAGRTFAKYGKWLAEQYNGALIVVERNVGGTVLESLAAENAYDNIYEDDDGLPGFKTTSASRPVILDTLEQASRELRAGKPGTSPVSVFTTHDQFLLAEMRTFVKTKKNRVEARAGYHDDLVMAAAIGWYVLCQPTARKRAASTYDSLVV